MSTKQSMFYLRDKDLMIHIYREMVTGTHWLEIHGKTEGRKDLHKTTVHLPGDIAEKVTKALKLSNESESV